MNTQDSLIFKDMMSLNKTDAIKKYGNPHFQEQFIMNNSLGRFRSGLYAFYPKRELFGKSIVIDELTWEKDTKTWITVWYSHTKEKNTPIDYCIWNKGTDFYSFQYTN